MLLWSTVTHTHTRIPPFSLYTETPSLRNPMGPYTNGSLFLQAHCISFLAMVPLNKEGAVGERSEIPLYRWKQSFPFQLSRTRRLDHDSMHERPRHFRSGVFSCRSWIKVDPPKAFRLPCLAISHKFYAGNRSVAGETLSQLSPCHRVLQATHPHGERGLARLIGSHCHG